MLCLIQYLHICNHKPMQILPKVSKVTKAPIGNNFQSKLNNQRNYFTIVIKVSKRMFNV